MFISPLLGCPEWVDSAGLKKGKKAPGERLSALTRLQTTPSLVEISPSSQDNSPQPRIADSVHKSRQLFIRTQNETLSVVAMCVSNPDRSPAESRAGTQPQLQPALLRL